MWGDKTKIMTKKYIINGREIPEVSLDKRYPEQMPLVLAFTNLLEALDEKKDYSHDTKNCEVCKTGLTCRKYVDSITGNEKKEECEHNLNCKHAADILVGVLSKEEPKSTLKEKIAKILMQSEIRSSWEDDCADKIISLFKDTLLKEIDTKAEYFKTETGREIIDYKDIINLIKNI